MAIIVKGEITITKGFDTWKAMVKKNQLRMKEMGMVMLFAGVQKDDPSKLHAIMKFPNLEALHAFGTNEELTNPLDEEDQAYIQNILTSILSSEIMNQQKPFDPIGLYSMPMLIQETTYEQFSSLPNQIKALIKYYDYVRSL